MAKNSSHHCFITSVRITNISSHQKEPTRTLTTYKIILAPCAKIYTYTPDKDKAVATHTMKTCRDASSVPLLLSLDAKWT